MYYFYPIIVILFLVAIVKNNNKSAKETQNNSQEKPISFPKIKYDKKNKRVHGKVAVICTIAEVIVILVLVISSYKFLPYYVAELCIFVLIYLHIAVVLLWIVYLDSVLYLKKLEKHGYQVPENKHDYDNRLDMLARIREVPNKTEGNSKESIALAMICWGIAFLTLISAPVFLYIHYEVKDVAQFCMFGFAFIALIWVLLGREYWKERSYSKYRDDVETEENVEVPVRKKRVSFFSGMVCIFIILGMSNALIMLMDMGADYVTSAREQARIEEQQGN